MIFILNNRMLLVHIF